MLWIGSVLSLKLAVPKKLAKSLKTICDKLRFYCICRLWGSHSIKKRLSLVFLIGFAKLAYPLHYTGTYTSQKITFFLKDLVTFIEEILSKKLNFCAVLRVYQMSYQLVI